MEQPLISVIVPTYNRQELLKETLLSILGQTYQNIEVIVVDNCSNYAFFESINSLNDPRIRPFQNANGGVIAVNRNFGMQQAKGEYIAFCDDDDLWLPEKLKKQVKILQEKPEILLVGTNIMTFPNGRRNGFLMSQNQILSFEFVINSPFSITSQSKVATSSVLFHKNIVNNISFLDEDRKLAATEDYDYWVRILRYKDRSILVLKEELVRIRIHNNNITKFDPNKPNVFDRLILVYQKYPNTEHLIRKIELHKKKFIVKNLFNQGDLTWKGFMDQGIPFTDKMIIVAKKIYSNVFGNW